MSRQTDSDFRNWHTGIAQVLSKVSNRLFIRVVMCAVAVYTEIDTAEHYVRSWLSQSWYRISLSFRICSFQYTISPFNIHFSVTTNATLGNTNDAEFRAFIVCISVWGSSNCRKGIRLTQTWHFTKECDSPPPYVQYTGTEMTASLVHSLFSQHIAQTLIS